MTIAALLAGIFALVGLPLNQAAAETNTPPSGGASNPFFVYVQAGEYVYATSETLNGVLDQDENAVASGGANLYGPASDDGVWQVDIGAVNDADTMVDWEVTARDASNTDILGRVWSELYGTRQAQGDDGTFRYWVINDSGYIYDVTFADYNGIQSRFRADSIGNPVNKAEGCEPSYLSKESDGGDNGWDVIPDCGGEYRIFFAPPAADLPTEARLGNTMIPVRPTELEADDLQVEDLAFSPDAPGSVTGDFDWSINPRFTGGYWLEVDVDGDGEYDGEADLQIPQYADGSGTYGEAFDGLDGEGEQIPTCTSLNARVHFDRVGEVHFVQDDVEGRESGVSITRLNGEGSPDNTIYWDDTDLADNRTNSTPVLDGTDGADSSAGVHGWNYDLNSWGNNRVIDDWTFVPVEESTGEITFGGDCLAIDKTSDATEDTRVGDAVTYTVTATNIGDVDYTEENPATVFDNLSGVLDDGDYNDDATADVGDDPWFVEPSFLRWDGALPAGESVELTYTVTLTGGGDGNVRNVAFAPEEVPPPDDPPVTVPSCDPANEDGRDPETGLPCAEHEFDLPRLTIEKTSDTTELPEDGGVVTYTIAVTNEGPGATTDDDDPVVDDLSDVLDDGVFVEDSEEATTGTVVFSQSDAELSWTGALAAGDSVDLTYEVTYDSTAPDGDHILHNVVCLPESLALDPDALCAEVVVPGAALQMSKSSDPDSGTSVTAGDVVTYTLTFDNVGEAAATVDTFDDLSNVFDDADYVEGSLDSSDGLLAELEEDQLLVTGSVEAGETSTVSYEVEVREYEDQGDHILSNVLDCPAGSVDCATENPIRNLDLVKDATPDEGVNVGDEVTYTITVTNNGEGDYTEEIPASIADDLSGVLDDADYNGDVAIELASGASAPAPVVDGDELTWSGPLAAGDVATVTYSVTVANDIGDGDHSLDNVVCETGTDNCDDVGIELPNIEFDKVSDPESGVDVEAGEVVTYTLSYTNTGQAPGPVDSTDDLSGVLDDADVTDGPTSSDDAVTATLLEDGIRVVGQIDPGETVTVSYEITVRPDGERGDNIVTNVLIPDAPIPPPPSLEHPIGELQAWKDVDPASGTTVQPEQELTYTLSFRNVGEALVEVDRDDVLTQVLDDAEIISDPVASDEALSVSELDVDRFTITGALEAGQTETVTYTVRVLPDGERGDDRLGNFLVPAGEHPPDECVVQEGQLPDCTVNHVSDVLVAKSADPESGTEVEVGEQVTYTLTFTNVSTNSDADPAQIDYTDHLVDVLDDADLVDGPASSTDAVTATAAGESIRIVGEVEPGQVATVTYTVEVLPYNEQGNHHLGNVVAVTGEEPVCAQGSARCTEHDVLQPPPGDDLPGTGVSVSTGVLVALLTLGLGGLLVGARRRIGMTA